ncbi:MAG: response regulator transcription factor [Crocinitomicaceae bacterium]|nr:response regulator transcription factor [Crocinitomicaceae bacterium]
METMHLSSDISSDFSSLKNNSENTKPFIILLADDEPDILTLLSYNLKKEGFIVHTANDGEECVALARQIKPHLILADVMMPKMDGIEACHIIRNDHSIPQPLVAFLTSRSDDYTQLAGFSAGADDYITKPIRPRVLISKVEALLRRIEKGNSNTEEIPKFGIHVNRSQFIASKNGEEVMLPKKEFELLELLLTKPGKVFTRDEILDHVWGKDVVVGVRTIDVHIRKLREKLGNEYIRTIKGIGYTFRDEQK